MTPVLNCQKVHETATLKKGSWKCLQNRPFYYNTADPWGLNSNLRFRQAGRTFILGRYLARYLARDGHVVRAGPFCPLAVAVCPPGLVSPLASPAFWSRVGRGIFWVSGKPGYEKPTLMKFLADNPQTRAALVDRAGDRRVVVTSHYFWWYGTAIQEFY